MKKLIIISTLLIMQISFVAANANIVVVDMDKILNVTKVGASIQNQLSKINDKILMDFKKQEEKLKNKEIKLISQKNILSENDFDTNIKNFKAEIEQYNVNRKKTITNFNKKKNENTKEFLLIVNKILAEYSDSKSISMIFQKKDLVIAKTELDITDEIIVIIDKNIKNFKVK
jgi:outer membrane protein